MEGIENVEEIGQVKVTSKMLRLCRALHKVILNFLKENLALFHSFDRQECFLVGDDLHEAAHLKDFDSVHLVHAMVKFSNYKNEYLLCLQVSSRSDMDFS